MCCCLDGVRVDECELKKATRSQNEYQGATGLIDRGYRMLESIPKNLRVGSAAGRRYYEQ
jgi:hypothetical protein